VTTHSFIGFGKARLLRESAYHITSDQAEVRCLAAPFARLFMKVGRVDAAHGWFSAIRNKRKKKKEIDRGGMATTRGLLLGWE